ncbi:MAG: hypothetical protein MZU97_19655 [Bacillus subtilis]|nr:hypothetical protein [Bacillus subtilis]
MRETLRTTPGKFYLMGEYGVVFGRSDAWITPTKAGLSVRVSDSKSFQITSSQWPSPIVFEVRDNRVVWAKNEPWVNALNPRSSLRGRRGI